MKPTIKVIARIYAAFVFVLFIALSLVFAPFFKTNPTETIVSLWKVRNEWVTLVADATYIQMTGGEQADLDAIMRRFIGKM